MTTERWTDESLDRFASTVVAAITASNEQIAANSEQIAANSKQIAANSEQLTRIGQLVESNNLFLRH